MKLNRLEYTKKLYPHWLDRNNNSNFVKHLKVVNHQQYDIYHKIKTVDWSRMLEKPIQIWKEQNEPYNYNMHFKVSVKYLKEINIYKNPKINKKGLIEGYDELVLSKTYANDDVNLFEYVHSDTSNLYVPRDTYILEIKTWDDYHFLKGFPENDYLFYNELEYKFNESFLRIEEDEISYSKFLTFRVHMDLIKLIQIFKNEELIYAEDFILEGFDNFHIYPTDYSYKYFDYTSYDSFEDIYEIEHASQNTKIIYRANLEKDEYVFRLPLTDDDFEIIFDYRNIIEQYPNITSYNVVDELPDPSEDLVDAIYVIKEDSDYNAYKVFESDGTYSFELVESNLDYKLGQLKDNYDLFVTVYDKRGKCNKKDILDYSKIITHSYDLDGCIERQYSEDDCIIVNKLPSPSINSLTKLIIIKENGIYRAYRTLYDENKNEYYFKLFIDGIEYSTLDIPQGSKVYKKRYSGYDNILGDCFDHDYSLDMIGHLFNIHRFKFIKIPYRNEKYYSRTYPKYNNRYTEDDYHYMKRIQYYISNYNQIYFPVLEFWKYYYTDSTLVNRKGHLGEQDYSYFRTNYSSDCLDEDGNIAYVQEEMIDEVFDDDATIDEYTNIELTTQSTSSDYYDNAVHYTVNKATVNYGSSNPINVQGYEHTWYESIIVNNVFVVPNTPYRIRYGVSNNEKPVTIRMICHNRQGQKLHSIHITDDSDDLDDSTYPTTEGYEYIDKLITIPEDTAYILLVLESDSSFDFADVTFQRKTVVGFDNKYMKSSLNWNSCVYDLYVNYSDIPVNISFDDSYKFNLLFKRSLPLTKIGYLNLNIDEEAAEGMTIADEYSFEIIDYFGAVDTIFSGQSEYSFNIEQFIDPLKEYAISYKFKTDSHTTSDESTQDYLVKSKVYFYDSSYNQIGSPYEFSENADSSVEAKANFIFETPENTENVVLRTVCSENFELWDISLKEYKGNDND